MKEGLKNRIILILAVLSLIFLVAAAGSCVNARHQKAARQKEMISRFELQEQMDKLNKEKSALEVRIGAIQKELDSVEAARQLSEKNLQQEQINSQLLKDELERLTKLKDTLEKDLKEVLGQQ